MLLCSSRQFQELVLARNDSMHFLKQTKNILKKAFSDDSFSTLIRTVTKLSNLSGRFRGGGGGGYSLASLKPLSAS